MTCGELRHERDSPRFPLSAFSLLLTQCSAPPSAYYLRIGRAIWSWSPSHFILTAQLILTPQITIVKRNLYSCVNISSVLVFAAMEGYITTTEAAVRLGISSARIRQLVANGKLPAQKFGPVNMVRESDLDLIRNRPSAGRPPNPEKRPTGQKQASNGTSKSKKGSKG